MFRAFRMGGWRSGLGKSPLGRRTAASHKYTKQEVEKMEKLANSKFDQAVEADWMKMLNEIAPKEAQIRYERHMNTGMTLSPAMDKEYTRSLFLQGKVDHPRLNSFFEQRAINQDAINLTLPNPIAVDLVKSGQSGPFQTISRLLGICVSLSLMYMVYKLMTDGNSGGSIMGIRSAPKKVEKAPTTRFDDVRGIDEVKVELEEVVDYLRFPEKYTKLGAKLPKGILLSGPPGTGKTLLAKAIAGEAGVPFFYASGSEFDEMFVGVGSRRVRDLFKSAKAAAPAIIFIDEIDSIGNKRTQIGFQGSNSTLNQLLTELDGFEGSEGVIIIGATNYVNALDKALIRPGRFDKTITVPIPDIKGRHSILELYGEGKPLADDIDLLEIAKITAGFTGADLFNLMNRAALLASRGDLDHINQTVMSAAVDDIIMGVARLSKLDKDVRELTAYHESGHALVAMYSKAAMPIHKATIVPRGRALGMVSQVPEKDQYSVTYDELRSRLQVCMGGRVAEELIFGKEKVTTGASSDFQQATNIAKQMVFRWGMTEQGKMYIDEEMEKTLSSSKRAMLEAEVQTILDETYEEAFTILKNHKNELHLLAKALLEYETLSRNQIDRVVKGMKPGI